MRAIVQFIKIKRGLYEAISVLDSLVVMTLVQLVRGQGSIPVEEQNFFGIVLLI